MNPSLKVGDVVIVIFNLARDVPNELVNKIGTIKNIKGGSFGVEFNFKFAQGHGIDGNSAQRQGYYFGESSLKLAEKLLSFT